MALLPPTNPNAQQEEDNQQQPKLLDTTVPKPQQPAQPAQPVQPAQQNQARPLIQQNQQVRKGSGFTNLNRIMQANRGSNLGQNLAGGVAGQTQKFQSGVQQSQQKFTEESNKARLDTPEAAAKRGAVLGRFDESQYNVDESQFKMNEQIQQDYQQKKTAQEQALAKQQETAAKQRALVEKEIAEQTARRTDLIQKQQAPELKLKGLTDAVSVAQKNLEALENSKPPGGSLSRFQTRREKQALADHNAKIQMAKDQLAVAQGNYDKYAQATYRTGPFGTGGHSSSSYQDDKNALSGVNRDVSSIDAGVKSLQQILSSVTGSSASAEKAIQQQISDYEAQYGKLTADEKAKWVQSEKDRMVAENLPSEEEMRAFQKYQTGAYTGPKELQDFGSLLGRAQQTEQLGQLARSTGGREELLKRFVGGRDYTQGQRGLDTAILGQEDTSALTKAARETRGAEKDVTRANRLAGAQAQELVGKAKQFGDETRGMIESSKGQIQGRIGQQLEKLKQAETRKQEDFGNIQNILGGKGEFAKLDPMARTGLALQMAKDSGYISPEEATALVSSGGLVKRAGELGTDFNKLLSERFKSSGAVGLDNEQVAMKAAASADQETRVRALEKLMGKTGTDLSYGGDEQFQAGKVGLDFDNLAQEIARQEAARMQSDAGYSQKMQQQKLTPLQQILGGAGYSMNAIDNSVGGDVLKGAAAYGGLSSAAGALGLGAGGGAGLTATGAMGAAAPWAAAAMLGADMLTGGDSTAQAVEGATVAGMGAANAANQGAGSLIEGLRKLNIGGVSLENSPIGSQLAALEKFRSDTAGKVIGEVGQNALTYGQGLRDLTQTGKLDQALAKLSGFDNASRAVSNVGKTVSKALFGGKTGDWKPHEYNTIDANTGKKVKIGSFANQSSDKILQQMLTQGELDRATIHGKGGTGEGAKVVNELLKYYNAALKREGKA